MDIEKIARQRRVCDVMGQKENQRPTPQQKPSVVREGGMTYDDYAALDDGNRYELAAGRLELMSPSPSPRHQLLSYELLRKLADTCERDYIILNAPIDLILSPSEVRQPDLLLVRRDRIHILTERGVEGPPDLVVEILSPSTLQRDKVDKAKVYAFYRIPEYWIVEPQTFVLEQYILEKERYELTAVYHGEEPVSSPGIPCISFTMQAIAERIPDIGPRAAGTQSNPS
nr:Uma2 family endonuclease [Kyrpidia tusciae]